MQYQTQRLFLEKAILKGKLSHSYIFSGTDDLAFSTEIAKLVLCKQEHTGCDSCSSCLKINSGNHPDLMIVVPDGSSIKNAQVEAFQEYIYIKPFESDFKIVIFKDLDLMTPRAQNRILKTLEEPPEYALFIFMTHNLEAILETVVSRCQVLQFYHDLEEKGLEIEQEILDKAIEFVKSIEFKDVNRVFEFALYAKEDKQRFQIVINRVSKILRDVMIFRETENLQLINSENFTILDYRDQLEKLTRSFTTEKLVELIFIIDDVESKLKNNMNFELTIDQLLFKCIQ